MIIEDEETLQMYVEESREHLADIENDILAIEECGENIDEELVNKVFRAAHSIKGGAGFMGLNNIKELSHKMENVLGMVRDGKLIPNAEITNILLEASDVLREMINDVHNSNDVDISRHVDALNAITESKSAAGDTEKQQPEEEQETGEPGAREGLLFDVEVEEVNKAIQKGNFIYLVNCDLIADVQEKGKTLNDFISGINDCGQILDCHVDTESAGSLENFLPGNSFPMKVLFASIIEPDLITAVFDIDDAKLTTIKDENEVASVLGKPETPGGREEPEKPSGETTEAMPAVEEQKEVKEKVEEIPKLKPAPAKPKQAEPKPIVQETSLRVHVQLLDSLMNLAGELVLSRNQLLQAVGAGDQHQLEVISQRIDMITSDLQEAIMLTRMQPVGNIFNKFPRVVRDLARKLGKEVELKLEGKDVELDKTIIEAISDPLTHLVRNAVDHGIESPDERVRAGKDPKGTVILRAYHEAGQVNIEIADDGKGLDPEVLAAKAVAKGLITEEQAKVMSDKEKVNLIFYPGFSTAEKVTDVSGRGVGMDVVKTNLDKLGGEVELESTPGIGTTIKIKLPLTLTIIPSLLVSTCGDKYAIPQINIEELLRIASSQVKDRIEKVGNAEVVRLRGQLLPLVRLSDALDIDRIYFDKKNGQPKPDRRESLADRRSKSSPYFYDEESGQKPVPEVPEERRTGIDRRYHASSAVNIVVVSAGPLKYGLVVDELHDSEEIVVKPLGKHIKKCRGYIGATILGDGRVALILDIPNIARMTNLTSVDASDRAREVSRAAAKESEDIQSLVIFRNAEDEQFAIPLGLVQRIERVKRSEIETIGNRRTIQYRGRNLPLVGIEEVVEVKPLADHEDIEIIVFKIANREVGLLATGPIDVLDVAIEIDTDTLKQQGILGSTIINGQTTLMLDIYGLVKALYPSWFTEMKTVETEEGKDITILLAEDSDFFRAHVKKFLEDEGYRVIEAEDGLVAWNILQERSDEIDLVLTDIEMPNMDGFALTEKIKTDDRYKNLPVIALTTLADDESIEKGKAAGVNDYQIKLDKERLIEGIYKVLKEQLVPGN